MGSAQLLFGWLYLGDRSKPNSIKPWRNAEIGRPFPGRDGGTIISRWRLWRIGSGGLNSNADDRSYLRELWNHLVPTSHDENAAGGMFRV
jgi:hypothetical protein